MAISGFWRSAQDPERVMHVEVRHWQAQQQSTREDLLTVEEPFEVRVNDQNLAMIMRTPGHDEELAMGFLLTEGVLQRPDAVQRLEPALDEDGLPLPNVLNVLMEEAACTAFTERPFTVSSSCGLCGKNRISELMQSVPPLDVTTTPIPAATFYQLADQLRSRQDVFSHTGGLHAAGLFSLAGELLLLREDVGRHNAVDKIIGHGLLHMNDKIRYPYTEHILLVSGRTSYEIIQKALYARIPCVAAISAPSSLAVELAARSGITLIGFLRNQSMNVYTHAARIV